MDLPKAFDTLNRNLLLAKLNTYDSSFNATRLVQRYFSEQFQRVNINKNFKMLLELRLLGPRSPFIQYYSLMTFSIL